MPETKKKKRGDIRDGRYLRSLDAYNKTTTFIMKTKNDATNYFLDSVDVTDIDRYLRRKRAEGYKGMGMLHLFLAAYVRTVSQRPAINRFISGQRIYARNNIEIIITVKKEMTIEGSETSLKLVFAPTDTIFDVYDKINRAVETVKGEGEDTNTDDVADALMKMPRLLMKFVMFNLNILDYFGKIPASLIAASPFHGSMVVTDLGSLGIPPVFHHLYNFGNVPVFMAFGAKTRKYELDKDGNVQERKYITYTVSSDERICDGFYFASAFKYMKRIMKDPEMLERPPEAVVEDVD